MKIADVRAYPLRTRTALVRVFTDGGVEGIGECSPMSVPVMCHFVQTVLRPLVLGKDPLDVERLWDAMYQRTARVQGRPDHLVGPSGTRARDRREGAGEGGHFLEGVKEVWRWSSD
jgi:L-alanine-DL-glutamate epimerase-like enolase superfamily enzyme